MAGGATIARGLTELGAEQPSQPGIVEIAAIIAGVLLTVGLWTPVSGCLVAAFALWALITQSGDLGSSVFLAAMGVALAMIGPGVWSFDARLFGWTRIVIRNGQG